ncbi:unnamed protein product [Choristocarpus tenellus]
MAMEVDEEEGEEEEENAMEGIAEALLGGEEGEDAEGTDSGNSLGDFVGVEVEGGSASSVTEGDGEDIVGDATNKEGVVQVEGSSVAVGTGLSGTTGNSSNNADNGVDNIGVGPGKKGEGTVSDKRRRWLRSDVDTNSAAVGENSDGSGKDKDFSAGEEKYKVGYKILEVLEARVQGRPKRYPRVIVIGDVHGCVEELSALLRRVQYYPGDLLLFLGDLVAKGPDSPGVIRMARELGAVSVRGNHEFEVLRCCDILRRRAKAKSDDDFFTANNPMPRSQHYRIAQELSREDRTWLKNCPWYITSKDLGALFVHAGIVSGTSLIRQNPRVMMNMRSLLPDGTVSSKCIKDKPWAKKWPGPLKVFFGHDAERGLQLHEHATGLDTGCVYGGRLTACILPGEKLYYVESGKEYQNYNKRARKKAKDPWEMNWHPDEHYANGPDSKSIDGSY